MKTVFSKFPSNSEADALELIENLNGVLPVAKGFNTYTYNRRIVSQLQHKIHKTLA